MNVCIINEYMDYGYTIRYDTMGIDRCMAIARYTFVIDTHIIQIIEPDSIHIPRCHAYHN